jgi:hypothetical protein
MPICYRDRSYCTHLDCQNQGCLERVTKELEAKAKAFGLPLSYTDFRRTGCGWMPPDPAPCPNECEGGCRACEELER